MNQEHHTKAVVYIIIAIIVIGALAAFIYITLSSKQQPASTGQEQAIVLTAEQSAQKTAEIEAAIGESQSPVILNQQQASQKAAIINSSAGEQ